MIYKIDDLSCKVFFNGVTRATSLPSSYSFCLIGDTSAKVSKALKFNNWAAAARLTNILNKNNKTDLNIRWQLMPLIIATEDDKQF